MKIHWSVTRDRVMKAFSDPEGSLGFCLNCGAEREGIEPDAREYECCKCGSDSVYGVDEVILMLYD